MMRIDAMPHVERTTTGRRTLAEAFRQSTPARLAAGLLLTLALLAGLAPWLAPQDPFDPAASQLRDAERPPAWLDAGDGPRFVLGTDEQGRDLLSLVLHGARLSLVVGTLSVLLALLLGLPSGLVAGFARGPLDAVLMRVADVQLSIPPMLLALAIDGVVTSALPPERRAQAMLPLVILAIGLSQWVVFARTVRGAVLVEREKEYVAAARALGAKTTTILRRHVLPNVLAPVIVLATVQLASAVLIEATLSFLGVGLPPTSPSLGTLIRVGSDYLLAGRWWMTVFPGLVLVLLAGCMTALGDWMRGVLNPRLGNTTGW